MLIKKLAVPLINNKILQETVHCTIATATITEGAFDLVMNKLPRTCKVEIVTGLHPATSPELLTRILKHFPDRVTLHVHMRRVFHANAYIFDLPYRKAVAFVGSGSLTLGGIKDHEEIFFRITDAKDIEELRSWFTGYFEFAEPLSEKVIESFQPQANP
jgi:HKD family nuclease